MVRVWDQPAQHQQKPAAATAKIANAVSYLELDETEETKPVNDKKADLVAQAKLLNQLLPSKQSTWKNPGSAGSAQAAKVELVQTAEGLKAEPAKNALLHPQQARTVRIKLKPRLLPNISSVRKLKSRRRPGPSMNPFLDMARQVKTPG